MRLRSNVSNGPAQPEPSVTGGSAIDTSFDVRTDAGGRDPDSHSATLRLYHQVLWSKPLPSGTEFNLNDSLRHTSSLGSFSLASDAITHTYSRVRGPRRIVAVVSRVPDADIREFYDLGCTVGAYAVFPKPAIVDGKRHISINQGRGMHPRIRDRFDLTLECIKRFYLDEPSPLSKLFAPYTDFFTLFDTFDGYVDHFLLQDLVSSDYSEVKFWKGFTDFTDDPLPAASVAEYLEYRERSMRFIRARNQRIEQATAASDSL